MRDGAGDGSLMRPMVGTLLPALRGGVSVSTTAPDPEWCAGMLHGGLVFLLLNPGLMVGVGTRRQDGWFLKSMGGPSTYGPVLTAAWLGVWSGFAVRRGTQWLGRPCDCAILSARSVGQCRRIAQFHGESEQ